MPIAPRMLGNQRRQGKVRLPGERYMSALANSVGGQRFRDSISRQAAQYWSLHGGRDWESNSHWRNAIGEEAWLEVGNDHWEIYQRFASSLAILSPGIVIEWGAGGGANAAAFAPRATRFIAADISEANLAECARQIRSVCDTPTDSRVIDLTDPDIAVADLTGRCNTFLCLYVLELTTGRDEVARILRLAERVLAPAGLAVVQIKYHTAGGRTRGRPGLRYTRNIASTTTFTIDDFWHLAGESGLRPELITLVPQNRLDLRYAYFALSKPSTPE